MGVLNVTPDSFSDGGAFADPGAAARHAAEMEAAGADLIDIGGESTRPGSEPVAAAEQIRRIVPVIRELAKRPAVLLSVDTTRAAVAEAALDAGAGMVNDISAGRDDPAMLERVARRRVPMVLMHMQGVPAMMQTAPRYGDVVAEVAMFLRERIRVAVAAGIDANKLLIDPGIGFGKTTQHNLELLKMLSKIAELGRPLVLGASRKAFIGKITAEPQASHRIFGTAACVAWGVAHGAAIVRVHDVQPMAQVVRMIRAIQAGAAG